MNEIKIETIDGDVISKKDIKKNMEVIITWDDGSQCIYKAKKDYNPIEIPWWNILGSKIILKK